MTTDRMIVSFTVGSDGAGSQTEQCVGHAVVLATGGFGASKDLLKEHNPMAAPYATMAGGGLSAGVKLMDQVQLHPTGLVDPANPDAGTKFLGPERLRGVGGILVNASGKRFVNELERRDTVTEAILRQEGQCATLLLPDAGAQEYGVKAMDFYCFKGFATKVANIEEAAAALKVDLGVLRE
eukprot:CAMPEP_0177789310 /NCGR_PEP_ID=MMETSP0491_2-20121128/22671_1 /TAXON_ID=63592 /ORGANISM="Tetraselmis chuii, Strain PLY429" /LENGTH=181 /DNA_ID=CAMNT_0019311145 /DNA_START=155 /DNA_END=697 /DNA_ORIENTATION=-